MMWRRWIFRARPSASVFVACLLLCTSVLITSGRLGSADAGAQLNVAEGLVRGEGLSRERPPSDLWLRGQNGRFYQVHDLGNDLFFLPAALAGRLAGADPSGTRSALGVRFLVSMTYAVLSAAGLMGLWLAIKRLTGRPRIALATVILFLFGTIYAAYQKTAYDMLGATIFVCLLIVPLLRLCELGRNRPDGRALARWGALTGLALGAAGLFRVTLLPFLAIGVTAAVLASLGRRGGLRALLPLAGVAFLVTIPTLAYNAVRTGNPLKPLTAEYYNEVLSRDVVTGLITNLFSLSKGLFAFSPALLLLGAAAWRRVRRAPADPPRHDPLVWMLLGCGLYVVFISLQPNTDATGWGPRYLLPVVPVMVVFIARELAAVSITGWRRGLAILLVATSVVLGLLPLLSSWNDDTTEYRVQAKESSIWRPVNQEAVTHAVADRLLGRPRYGKNFAPIAGRTMSEEQAFPDLWWLAAIDRGGVQAAAAFALIVALLALGVAAGRAAWQDLESSTRLPVTANN